ncbi:MAG: choice-of-anchor V domain-containing protein [Bacteroidota bacterium]
MLRLATALVLVALVVFTMPDEAATFSSGAPANRSGAPGESTCATAGCHSSFGLNSGTGSVTIDAPDGFVPGEALTFTVSVDNTTPATPQRRNGFQTSVKDDAGNDVGTLELVDPSVTRFSGTDHVTHTSSGTSVSSWQVRWIAPAESPGQVTIYAAGNAANGNGASSGDFIYTTSQTLGLATNVEDGVPEVVVLDAVWPNPTRGAATLSFALAAPTDVTVTLVDGLGRTVVEAQRGALGAGAQTVALDASGLVPGVYFAAVTVGGGTAPESRRVLPLTVAR